MLGQITIFRHTGNGRNALVFDVLERIGHEECGSAANAIIVCVRESPRFQAMLKRMRQEGGEGASDTKETNCGQQETQANEVCVA